VLFAVPTKTAKMPRASGGRIRLLGTAVSRRALFLFATAGCAIVTGEVGTKRLMGDDSIHNYIVMWLGVAGLVFNAVCFLLESTTDLFSNQVLLGLAGMVLLACGGGVCVVVFIFAEETVSLVAGGLGVFISGGLTIKETNVVKKKLSTEYGEVRNGGYGISLVCSLIMYVAVSAIHLNQNMHNDFLRLQYFNPIDSFRLAAVVTGALCLIASGYALVRGHALGNEILFYQVMTAVLLLCSAVFPTISGERIISMTITLFAAMCCSASIVKDVYHNNLKSRKKQPEVRGSVRR
jgi:hypothetical protein